MLLIFLSRVFIENTKTISQTSLAYRKSGNCPEADTWTQSPHCGAHRCCPLARWRSSVPRASCSRSNNPAGEICASRFDYALPAKPNQTIHPLTDCNHMIGLQGVPSRPRPSPGGKCRGGSTAGWSMRRTRRCRSRRIRRVEPRAMTSRHERGVLTHPAGR